jgi:hypothetical protein
LRCLPPKLKDFRDKAIRTGFRLAFINESSSCSSQTILTNFSGSSPVITLLVVGRLVPWGSDANDYHEEKDFM